mmetsp:Transcript_122/g.359  ORF Transcript_122/g.359 Transcript_122/m.359 type:complete len:202 (+) Transcript_122:1440-2045(+)
MASSTRTTSPSQRSKSIASTTRVKASSGTWWPSPVAMLRKVSTSCEMAAKTASSSCGFVSRALSATGRASSVNRDTISRNITASRQPFPACASINLYTVSSNSFSAGASVMSSPAATRCHGRVRCCKKVSTNVQSRPETPLLPPDPPLPPVPPFRARRTGSSASIASPRFHSRRKTPISPILAPAARALEQPCPSLLRFDL